MVEGHDQMGENFIRELLDQNLNNGYTFFLLKGIDIVKQVPG